MKYILKNKDIDVLEFEINDNTKILNGQNVAEQNLMNVNTLNDTILPFNLKENLDEQILKKWIEKRKIPSHRKYAKKILATAGIDERDLMGYIGVSLGLSLNDSLWIVPADKDYKWKDFNLYQNTFSKALELAAFGVISSRLKHIDTSPELTTNGALPKCWHRENGQIYLYKGTSKMNDGADEPYSEFYMAQIADIMGFDYVPYDLKEFHGKIVSSCPIFTNEDEGYLPLAYCLSKAECEYARVELANAVYKIYDNDKFNDLMVFDSLICNTDRHLGNFGFIIDNNASKILRPAPIFDNGLSVMTYIGFNELDTIKDEMSHITGHFKFKFDEQLKLFVQPRHIPNLEKLASFKFKKHSKFNLSDEWLEPIQNYIQDRARLALQFACEKQENSQKIKSSFRTDGSDSTSLNSIRNEMLGSSTQQANKQKPSADIDEPSSPKGPRR